MAWAKQREMWDHTAHLRLTIMACAPMGGPKKLPKADQLNPMRCYENKEFGNDDNAWAELENHLAR